MVGVFGGAFDPPHVEHKNIVIQAIKELKLDKVILLPSNNAPHKNITINYQQRKEIIKLAFKSIAEKIDIDDLEFKNDKKNYTIDNLDTLLNKYGDDLYFIIGGDSLIDLHKWKSPEQIVKKVKIAVVARGREQVKLDATIDYWKSKGAKEIVKLDYIPFPISSSEIRQKIKLNTYNDNKYLDDDVYKYIIDNNVYKNYKNEIESLKQNLAEKRFNHSLRVVEYGLILNKKLHLDEDKVITATLMHDNAKSDKILQEFILSNNFSVENGFERFFSDNGYISPVLHAFVGAHRAKTIYKIEDEEVLNAIRYHSTGRANMTKLEKLVYCADFLEFGREYDLDDFRKLIEEDFEKGFFKILEFSYFFLLKKRTIIDELTKEAYEYYLKRSEYGN